MDLNYGNSYPDIPYIPHIYIYIPYLWRYIYRKNRSIFTISPAVYLYFWGYPKFALSAYQGLSGDYRGIIRDYPGIRNKLMKYWIKSD